MNGHYSPGDVVLGNWTLVKLLGQGSFGKVFEAEREDFGTVYKSAIKIITVPYSDSEIVSARAEGLTETEIEDYFRSVVREVVGEFELMSRLKGTANVVSYEDHSVIQHTEGIGWDVIIRMELLTPMLEHMSCNSMTRMDVIQLGVDICKALELCQRYNIIHRDIKPENIFVSAVGDYKLGDFGIARTIEKASGNLSKKGTYTYMAPEVYKEEPYGSSVDIYSLGIVMYRLLNHNRAPFLPLPPDSPTSKDRECAVIRRINGEALPVPANAEGRLAEIVMKACAYDPRHRYSSPLQMRQELENISYNRQEDALVNRGMDQIHVSRTAFMSSRNDKYNQTVSQEEATVLGTGNPSSANNTSARRKKNGVIKFILAGLAVILAAASIWFGVSQKKSSSELPDVTSGAILQEQTSQEATEVPISAAAATTEATEESIPETEPDLYPGFEKDKNGFVVVDNSSVPKGELCVLGYKISDGSVLNNPNAVINGTMTQISFSWAEQSEVTSTNIAAYQSMNFMTEDVKSIISNIIPIWKSENMLISVAPESYVKCGFSAVPAYRAYVLLISLDKDFNYVKHGIIKIGYAE